MQGSRVRQQFNGIFTMGLNGIMKRSYLYCLFGIQGEKIKAELLVKRRKRGEKRKVDWLIGIIERHRPTCNKVCQCINN